MKSMRMEAEVNVACMGRRNTCRGFWWRNQIERDYREDLDVGGKIILNCILEK
jgi:hypothetical protein